MTKTIQTCVRLEPKIIEDADQLAAELAKTALPGMEPTRAGVLRAAIVRGLEVIRAELKKPKKR